MNTNLPNSMRCAAAAISLLTVGVMSAQAADFVLDGKHLIISGAGEPLRMALNVSGIEAGGWVNTTVEGLPEAQAASGNFSYTYEFKGGEKMELVRELKVGSNSVEGLEKWNPLDGALPGLIFFQFTIPVEAYPDAFITTSDGKEVKVGEHASPEKSRYLFSTKADEVSFSGMQGQTIRLSFPNAPVKIDVESWMPGVNVPSGASITVRAFWPQEAQGFIYPGEMPWKLTVE